MKFSLHRTVEHARSVRGMLVDSHREIHAQVYECMQEAK